MLASARKQVAQTDSNMIVEAAREGMEVVLKAQA